MIEFAPFILVSLPAGVWVDRLRRKPILVAADFGRALLLASIPVAHWLGVLTIWQLYVVGFAVGFLTVFFDVSYQSYLPSLVERDQLIEGNSKLEISRSGAQLAGPGLGGVLVEALTAPVAVLVDAISFLASAIFLFRIRKEETAPTRAERGAGPGMKAEVAEGLRWVFGNRYLRWIAASTATFNFFGNIIFAVILVYAVRELGLRPRRHRTRLRVSNVGYLLGALVANRLSRRFGVGPAIIIGALGSTSLLLLAVAPKSNPIPFLIACARRSRAWASPIYNITQVSFRQAITPERIQGRMNSVMRFIVWGECHSARSSAARSQRGSASRTAIWVGAIGMSLRRPPGPAVAGADAAQDAGAGRGAAAVRGGRGRRAAPGRGRCFARTRLTPAQRYGWDMPELPEVEAWVREPRPARVAVADPQGRAGSHRDLEDVRPAAAGARRTAFEGAQRRGKWLLFPTKDGEL